MMAPSADHAGEQHADWSMIHRLLPQRLGHNTTRLCSWLDPRWHMRCLLAGRLHAPSESRLVKRAPLGVGVHAHLHARDDEDEVVLHHDRVGSKAHVAAAPHGHPMVTCHLLHAVQFVTGAAPVHMKSGHALLARLSAGAASTARRQAASRRPVSVRCCTAARRQAMRDSHAIDALPATGLRW